MHPNLSSQVWFTLLHHTIPAGWPFMVFIESFGRGMKQNKRVSGGPFCQLHIKIKLPSHSAPSYLNMWIPNLNQDNVSAGVSSNLNMPISHKSPPFDGMIYCKNWVGFQFGGKNWSFRLFFFFFWCGERERERERDLRRFRFGMVEQWWNWSSF